MGCPHLAYAMMARYTGQNQGAIGYDYWPLAMAIDTYKYYGYGYCLWIMPSGYGY